ncbi:auxin-responsive protein SAUR71 [Amborella trichopoda]|uniref:auxin-responsive protein SAUR71 n=1 Tax=Amborella trichopoda TaxID=13333 RepID=UPI0005D39776|nr:auxin-responsive protein SAUR71 [Amborella trichopoda]|eukprot:XP_006853332.2 auxin-responsive protein SAUR71 [Amborella trichopoda]
MAKKSLWPLLTKKEYTRLKADDDQREDEGGKGLVPLMVGKEKRERFLIPAKLLNHPLMVDLLEMAAHEYGYEQEGALKSLALLPNNLNSLVNIFEWHNFHV